MSFTIALCQMKVTESKNSNIDNARKMISESAEKGAQLVVLPEMWNCPYSNQYFTEYSEPEGGDTYAFLSEAAKTHQIYLIGGYIPEMNNGRVYNSSYSFDRKGGLIGKHQKAHLFDIDVKGGIRFMESETLTAGTQSTIIDTEFGKIGVAICFDVRFPELFRKMTLEGAKLHVLPAAFNMTTGPAHWELSMRARALDNQVFFAACSPARDISGPYVAFGHSCVVTPWGDVCGKTDHRESIVLAEVDFDYVDSIREQLPLLKARRPELY